MTRWRSFSMRGVHRWLLCAIGLAAFVAFPVRAAALSQGYKTTETVQSGNLVALDPASDGAVHLANTERADQLIGVAVEAASSLLAVSSQGSNAQIVTSGSAQALVSTLGGDIKKGDAIAVSPINGVGMKATTAGRIVGLAEGDFSSSSSGAVSRQIDTKSGKKDVSVGAIPVTVSVGFYSPKSSATVVPEGVQKLATALAGKSVSSVRILIALFVLLFGIVITVIILNSAVRSSLESIGRNPLAKSAVSSSLLKVLFLTLAILLVTLGSVYLVIKG